MCVFAGKRWSRWHRWASVQHNAWHEVLVSQSCPTLCYPMDYSLPGSSRQEYWSGLLPFPSPGDLPNPGIKPASPALQADSLLSEPPGKPPGCGGCPKYICQVWQNEWMKGVGRPSSDSPDSPVCQSVTSHTVVSWWHSPKRYPDTHVLTLDSHVIWETEFFRWGVIK